jgi:hypothetical protein
MELVKSPKFHTYSVFFSLLTLFSQITIKLYAIVRYTLFLTVILFANKVPPLPSLSKISHISFPPAAKMAAHASGYRPPWSLYRSQEYIRTQDLPTAMEATSLLTQ